MLLHNASPEHREILCHTIEKYPKIKIKNNAALHILIWNNENEAQKLSMGI